MAEEVKGKYEPNIMGGILWNVSTNSPGAPKHSSTFLLDKDYKAGDKIKVAVWENISKKNNKPFFSYKVTEDVWQKQASQTPSAEKQTTSEPIDDDLPF